MKKLSFARAWYTKSYFKTLIFNYPMHLNPEFQVMYWTQLLKRKWFYVLSSYILCLINIGQVWNKEERDARFLLIENLVQSIECMPWSSFYVQVPN